MAQRQSKAARPARRKAPGLQLSRNEKRRRILSQRPSKRVLQELREAIIDFSKELKRAGITRKDLKDAIKWARGQLKLDE